MMGRFRYLSLLGLLIISAVLLTVQLAYLFVSDPARYPINTIKIIASYEHVSRKQIESILASYVNSGYFSLPVRQLRADLQDLPWTAEAKVERLWPDTLKITLTEKSPVAIFHDGLLSADGEIFNVGTKETDLMLPKLDGPVNQQKEILQMYQKLSKLSQSYGLDIATLQLRDNHAWDLSLTNGIALHLGKQDIETRLLRFCRSYPAVIADKPEQLSSIDLRYPHGMAVQWKQPMGR